MTAAGTPVKNEPQIAELLEALLLSQQIDLEWDQGSPLVPF